MFNIATVLIKVQSSRDTIMARLTRDITITICFSWTGVLFKSSRVARQHNTNLRSFEASSLRASRGGAAARGGLSLHPLTYARGFSSVLSHKIKTLLALPLALRLPSYSFWIASRALIFLSANLNITRSVVYPLSVDCKKCTLNVYRNFNFLTSCNS